MNASRLRLPLILLFLLPLALSAQDPADETSHRAAVKDLLKATRAEQLLAQSLSEVEALQLDLIGRMTKDKEAEIAKAITDQVLKVSNEIVMAKLSWTSMEAEYTRLYMKAFTEEEVRGMTAFYQSPLGQKVLDKTPALMGEIMHMTATKMGTVLPEIETATQKAVDDLLKKKEPAAPTPSL